MGRQFGPYIGALVLGMTGCGPQPHGFAWTVTLEMFEDECNDPPAAYSERMQYLLDFVGSDVTIAEGLANWGTGTIAGCSLVYTSPVWIEDRDGATISWHIDGDALIRQGGDTCGLENGVDWQGIETITIDTSTDPEIPVGCRYFMTTTGVYRGEL